MHQGLMKHVLAPSSPESFQQLLFPDTCRNYNQYYGSCLSYIRVEIRLEVTVLSRSLFLGINLRRQLPCLSYGESPYGTQGEYRTNLGNGVSVSPSSFRITLAIVS